MMRPLHFLPLLLFVLLAAALGIALYAPEKKPTAASVSALSPFTLASLSGKPFTPALWQGKPALLNIFASWCTPCRAEHPLLLELSKRLPVYGIAWHDTPEKVKPWLQKLGSPFRETGFDTAGELTVTLGLTGVPETFLLAADGSVLLHLKGPLTAEAVTQQILPLLEAK